MTPTLSIMVGVSGSGKSTYAEGLKTSLNSTIVSTDAIRGELHGDPSDQSNGDKVFHIAYKRVNDLLADGKNVIVDATCLNKKSRARWIQIGRKHKAIIYAYVIDTPIDLAKKRNLSRSRVVPDHVIDAQQGRLVVPTTDEGFDRITKVSSNGPREIEVK